MRVTIEAVGPIRRFLEKGASPVSLDLPRGSTVSDALHAIGVPDSQGWNASIEGQLVYSDRELQEGECVLVFSPITGGIN